jgi:hypothetical protein
MVGGFILLGFNLAAVFMPLVTKVVITKISGYYLLRSRRGKNELARHVECYFDNTLEVKRFFRASQSRFFYVVNPRQDTTHGRKINLKQFFLTD